MKKLYVKVILYAYPNLPKIKEQIERLIYKKAIKSRENFTPAFNQCQELVDLIFQENLIVELKKICDKVMENILRREYKMLQFRYFNVKKGCIDTCDREYYRKQNALLTKLSQLFKKYRLEDKEFESQYLTINFFKELYKIVVERELNQKKRNYYMKKKKESVEKDSIKEVKEKKLA